MGKFDGYLLLSDFDGTLGHTETRVDENGNKYYVKVITDETRNAVRYFQSEGGLFTLATGRQPSWIEQWKDTFSLNTYVSSLNGAYLYHPTNGHVLFSRTMDEDFPALAKRIFAECPALKEVRFTALEEEDSVVIKNGEAIVLPSEREFYKMVFITPKEYSDEYNEKIKLLMDDRYFSMRSWLNGIEVQMRGTGKGDSIARMKDALGDRARKAIAVGDYENDIDMIRAADIGYAVANAVEPLKAEADRMTVDVHESPIAKIVAELEREC